MSINELKEGVELGIAIGIGWGIGDVLADWSIYLIERALGRKQ